jgi:hypothetical protein
MRLVASVLMLGLYGCGGFPDPNAEPPAAPAENDPAFEILGGIWYLTGTPSTPSQDALKMIVKPPAGVEFVDAWVGGLPVHRLDGYSDGSFGLELDIAALPVGTHDILFAADGSTTAFARLPLFRSTPYYVLVTTDWDFADPGDMVIDYQNKLHDKHSQLRMTHFVGPYTFTDSTVTAPRAQQLVDWLVEQRDDHRDEIGLHIHPYCNFVESAGLTCITDQSTVYPEGDLTGYTIKCGAYDRQQFGTLLAHAKDLFQTHGLGTPRTFRAGGWTATIDTLNALADQGFTADTSALNWARIEEWNGKELYTWNMENWGPIGDTTQPYFPSQTDVLSSTAPTMSLLEVPDNGVMIDYVTLEEMTGLFDANWNGQPLETPNVLMMGFHPSTGFNRFEADRVDNFLDYADAHAAEFHNGPVVYITLEDLVATYQ